MKPKEQTKCSIKLYDFVSFFRKVVSSQDSHPEDEIIIKMILNCWIKFYLDNPTYHRCRIIPTLTVRA